MYAIDLPSNVDVPAVFKVLESREADGLWEFEEVHYFDAKTGV